MRRRLKLLLFLVTVAQGVGVVRAQTAETAAPATGAISGRVISTSGELPNSTIVYASASGATAPPRSVVVNSDGNFKIDGLDVGVYRIWAGAPGYVIDVPQPSEGRGLYHTGDSANINIKKGGVITGTVRNVSGLPLVAVNVRALRVRDENGKPLSTIAGFAERLTDDRGVYRIYGLFPGSYVVSAGGASRFFSGFGTAFDQETPTYAPSSTRDAAMEIPVRSGEENSADIQYRGEPGHAVSGTINGTTQGGPFVWGASVTVTDVKSRTVVVTLFSSMSTNYTFSANGLADGDYELVAQQSSPAGETRASDPKRIKVQGADVGGINLMLASLPAISGRVVLDKSFTAECVKRRQTVFQETMVVARRENRSRAATDEKNNAAAADQVALTFREQFIEAVPDVKGDFVLRNVHAGTFRLNVDLPSTAWYIRSATLGPTTRGADSKVISDGLTVNTQSLSGLTITIAEGAARIRGSVTREDQRAPDRVIVYLVPAEKEAASDLLRYFEARSEADGTFDLRNVPPGEYSLVALKADDDRAPGVLIRQDATLRTNVMREAEKLKQKLTLKPCERVDNFELPFPPATKP